MSAATTTWGRKLAWALGLFLGCVFVWLLASWLAVCILTGRARAVHPEPPPVVPWGQLEELRVTSSDGEDIGAWFASGQPGRPVVVLLHGNGGNRSACLQSAELVATVGCSVLLVTLRAHGDSSGTCNDFGYSARHDLIAAIHWVRKRQPNASIVVWGQSLGSAAALFASAELGEQVAGYILECPYRDLWTALRNRTRLNFPPGIEGIVYTGVALVGPLALPHADQICPVESASGIHGRALVLAGLADRKAHPDEAREIADRIGPAAELVLFADADHIKLSTADPAKYRQVVLSFLNSLNP